MSDELSTEETAAAYDEALAGGVGGKALEKLLAAHRQAEDERALAAWQEQQRAEHGDHLEFDGYVVTNIGVEPTIHEDEVN